MTYKPTIRNLIYKFGYELIGEGLSFTNLKSYRIFPSKVNKLAHIVSDNPYNQPFRIPINNISSRIGFSYSDAGWHPFVQTLREYITNPNLNYDNSSLAKLYSQYCPKNVQEVLLDHVNTPIKPFCDWPPYYQLISNVWTLNQYNLKKYLNKHFINSYSSGWIYFGPHSDEYGKLEFSRLINVFNSIKKNGYDQSLAKVDPVNGYFLIQGDSLRFILLQGNHRVSVLKAMGYTNVDVHLRRGHPAVIDQEDLSKWTHAGGGLYTPFLTQQLFDTLFNETGMQKAKRYGLLN